MSYRNKKYLINVRYLTEKKEINLYYERSFYSIKMKDNALFIEDDGFVIEEDENTTINIYSDWSVEFCDIQDHPGFWKFIIKANNEVLYVYQAVHMRREENASYQYFNTKKRRG